MRGSSTPAAVGEYAHGESGLRPRRGEHPHGESRLRAGCVGRDVVPPPLNSDRALGTAVAAPTTCSAGASALSSMGSVRGVTTRGVRSWTGASAPRAPGECAQRAWRVRPGRVRVRPGRVPSTPRAGGWYAQGERLVRPGRAAGTPTASGRYALGGRLVRPRRAVGTPTARCCCALVTMNASRARPCPCSRRGPRGPSALAVVRFWSDGLPCAANTCCVAHARWPPGCRLWGSGVGVFVVDGAVFARWGPAECDRRALSTPSARCVRPGRVASPLGGEFVSNRHAAEKVHRSITAQEREICRE